MRLMPSPRVFLPERAPDVERWVRGELPAEVVKQNAARTVWRVGAESPWALILIASACPPDLKAELDTEMPVTAVSPLLTMPKPSVVLPSNPQLAIWQ